MNDMHETIIMIKRNRELIEVLAITTLIFIPMLSFDLVNASFMHTSVILMMGIMIGMLGVLITEFSFFSRWSKQLPNSLVQTKTFKNMRKLIAVILLFDLSSQDFGEISLFPQKTVALIVYRILGLFSIYFGLITVSLILLFSFYLYLIRKVIIKQRGVK